MNAEREFVFAYGSLVAERQGCEVSLLHGYRRVWGVAMDNAVDLPGYKSYRLRADRSRPQVFVAFLDIEPDPACAVTGVCVPVEAHDLRALDDRERNYVRIDVTSALTGPCGRVWAYRGSERGRARLHAGRARGSAVVSREYLGGVLTGIAAIAPDEVAAVERAARSAGLAVLDLERRELPRA